MHPMYTSAVAGPLFFSLPLNKLQGPTVSHRCRRKPLWRRKMKTHRLQYLIVAAVVVCSLPSAWGAFGPLVTMGPTIVLSDPSCASPADGQAVCAARGLGQTLVVNKWSGSSWGGWKIVAGTVTSNPSCSSDGSGRVVCAARNDTGGISATVYNGTVWGRPHQSRRTDYLRAQLCPTHSRQSALCG